MIDYKTPTKVVEGGIIVDAENSVIGYKCLACSTAHTFEGNEDIDQMVELVTMWKESHNDC